MFDLEMTSLKKKWSIYNLIIVDNKRYTIIYNTVTGKICKVNKNHAKPLRLDNSTTSTLIEGGIWVEEKSDEFAKLLFKSRSISENTNHADIDITIAPSLQCNMRCKYCFENEIRQKNTFNVMSKETLKHLENFILNIANQDSVKNLNLIWFGGEPLLEANLIIEFSNCIKKKLHHTKQFHLRIITNGSLLTPKLLYTLINNCCLESVQISIDGQKEFFTQIRQVEARVYEEIVNNIIYCSNYIKTILRLNITPSNINDIYDFINKISIQVNNKQNIIFKIAEIINYSNTNNFQVETFKPGTFRRIHRKLAIHINQLGFNIDSYYIEKHYPIGCKYYKKHNYVIDPRGYLYKCEHHFGDAKYIIGDVESGVYSDNSIHHIYYNNLIDNRCKNCNIFPICKYASCPDYRQFIGNNETCELYSLQVETIITDIKLYMKHFTINEINA